MILNISKDTDIHKINKIKLPIIIISYNNHKYVLNTINQINRVNPEYTSSIIILDNCSDMPETKDFLQKTNYNVIINNKNNGPWIRYDKNPHIYNLLPNKYIITDPDLKFNENLPSNFIEILLELSEKYKTHKIGFALDISDFDKMYQSSAFNRYGTIQQGQLDMWKAPIQNSEYELYHACIDTTFCLFSKEIKSIKGPKCDTNQIRVAGIFLAKHLPWYINNNIYNEYENYLCAKSTTHISTISSTIIGEFDEKLSQYKNGKIAILIPSRDRNHKIKELYQIWDEYLDKTVETDCIILLDEDNESTYERLPNFKYEIVKTNGKRGVTYPLNQGAMKFCGQYEYIGFIGDDHRPKTKNWNSILYNKLKETSPFSMVYGNDLIQGGRIPTAIVMDSWYIRYFGYMIPPSITHLWCDNLWLYIGKEMNNIHYLKDVIIEHLHFGSGKSQCDAIYLEVAKTNQSGMNEFNKISRSPEFNLKLKQLKYFKKYLG